MKYLKNVMFLTYRDMTRTKAIETTTRDQSEANDTTEHRVSAVEPAVCLAPSVWEGGGEAEDLP